MISVKNIELKWEKHVEKSLIVIFKFSYRTLSKVNSQKKKL